MPLTIRLLTMKPKELLVRFITGSILYFLMYSGIQLVIEGEFIFFEALIMGILWSIGMLLFEWGWRRFTSKTKQQTIDSISSQK